MKKYIQFSLFLILVLFVQSGAFAQGCLDAANVIPICTDQPVSFAAGVDQTAAATDNPNVGYGCLGGSPNPAWYYLEIANPGTLAFDISNSANADVDWAVWGPFTDIAAVNAACGSGAAPFAAPVDCDYTTIPSGTLNVGTVATGEVYAILVTNFANAATDISMSTSAGSTASTNCDIVGGGAGCGCTNCPQALPDAANEDFFVNVNNDGAADCDLATNPLTSITLDMDHTYLGDLTITLTSPSGQTVTLIGPAGFTGGTLGGAYVFLPASSGATQWNNANTPVPGNYTPYIGDIGALTGNVCGSWTMNVTDSQGEDTGNFYDFQLGFADPTDLSCTSDVPCNPVWDGSAVGGWDAATCGYGASISLSVDYGTFVNPGPCVVAGALDINSTWYLHAMATTDGVLATYDPCNGEGIASTADQSFPDFAASLPANTTCDIQWYTIIPRLETSSSDATCQCNGTCHAYSEAAVNIPVYPDYAGLTAELVYTPGICNADGTYTPSTFVVTPGSSCDGSVVDASVMATDLGCGTMTAGDAIALNLAINPAGLPAGCSAAGVYNATVGGITCACPSVCISTADFSTPTEVCSAGAISFTAGPTCANLDGPAGQNQVVDLFAYAPGGVPGEAAAGYESTIDVSAPTETAGSTANDPEGIEDKDPNLVPVAFDATCAAPPSTTAIANQTCAPIVVTYFMVVFDYTLDSDGDTNAEYRPDCSIQRYDVTVYPAPLTVAVTDDGSSCGTPMVELRDAAGNVCSTMAGPACAANGDVFNYDFSADAVITALAGAPAACIPANLTGTITCAACSSCGANNGTLMSGN